MIGTQIYQGRTFKTEIAMLGPQPVPDIPIFSKRIETPHGELGLDIHWVRSEGLHSSACDLVNRRYGWRGYGSDHVVKRSPHHATFSAVAGDAVVGTVTLAVDSSAGLASDTIFREELDHYRRREHAHICEITKLAVDGEVQSPAILAALFHVILLYGQLKYSCTNLFIEVNPRHRRFYQSMLGFEAVGDLRTNDSVAAPSQLMHLEVGRIRPMIEAYRGSDPAAAARSLYPHFLTKREEETVLLRLFQFMGQAEPSGVVAEMSGPVLRTA